jgi:hypothetical protein
MSEVDGDDHISSAGSVDGDDLAVVRAQPIPRRTAGDVDRVGPLTVFFVVAVRDGIYASNFRTDVCLEELDNGAYHLLGAILGRWEVVTSMDHCGPGYDQLLKAAHSHVSTVSGYVVFKCFQRCSTNMPEHATSIDPWMLQRFLQVQVCLKNHGSSVYHSHQPLAEILESWQDMYGDGKVHDFIIEVCSGLPHFANNPPAKHVVVCLLSKALRKHT